MVDIEIIGLSGIVKNKQTGNRSRTYSPSGLLSRAGSVTHSHAFAPWPFLSLMALSLVSLSPSVHSGSSGR